MAPWLITLLGIGPRSARLEDCPDFSAQSGCEGIDPSPQGPLCQGRADSTLTRKVPMQLARYSTENEATPRVAILDGSSLRPLREGVRLSEVLNTRMPRQAAEQALDPGARAVPVSV